MTPPVLEVRDLVVDLPTRRGTLRAVDHVDLTVAPASLHALVGESGCGKTTTLRALLGLTSRAAGSVVVHTTSRPPERSLQFVPQDASDALDPRRTILDSISEPWRIQRRVPKAEWRDRATALCVRVGLSADLLDRYPDQLSGGQRQRVCIARALAPEPELVVLDEPFASLDAPVAVQLADLIVELQAIRATAFLLVSHDLAMVEHVADHVSVMYLGTIVESGPAAAVFADPQHPYTRALLAARPVTDPQRAREPNPNRITGEPPDPHQPPSGCRFRTRCPIARDECAPERPPLLMIGDAHTAACLFPGASA
ncbi:MAG: ABC transporter ATP-binding protein [Acidimicrobiia bacterium]